MPRRLMIRANVLALVTEAFGGRGGIAQYNRDFLQAVAASGLVASLHVLPRYATDRVNPSAGILQSRARSGWLAYSVQALIVSLFHPVDIVFCGHLYMAPLAALIAWLKKAKLIVQAHGIEAWSCPSQWRRKSVEIADLVFCVSRYTRARLIDWAAIVPERAIVLPNTVGDHFKPGESSLRVRWDLVEKRVLLTVGRLDARERYKGHDRVISSLPELLAKGHDMIYIVIGDGGDRARLEMLADHAGVGERVKFMGAITPGVLLDAYRLADVFVMPSRGEGFGISFLEAMACGTPALGLAACGARDAPGDGELGMMVAESDDFRDALATLIAAERPAPATLAARIGERFGQAAFRSRVAESIMTVL